jgi:putative ABC transport system permease protein
LVNKLVLENLKHRPVRTALSVVAIGVEVAMMLTLVGLSRGMVADVARRARGVGADIVVRPPGTSLIGLSSAPMSERMVDFLLRQPHVTHAVGSMTHPLSGVTTITGVKLEEFERISGGFKYLEGGPIRGPDQIIVDRYYAQQNHLRAGSTLRLLNREWRVAGVVEEGKLARLVIPLEVLQDLTANSGKISQVWVKLDDPANVPAVIASLKAQLKDYPIYSMEELTSLISVSNVPGLKAFIAVIVALAVVVGFLVVFLAMYTAVLERTREIGILKALGASPGYVLNILFRETLLLALAGTLLGILFSYLTRWVIMSWAPASLTQMIVPDWWGIAGLIALAGALLGATYPGWRAARQDPIEALAYE